MANATILEKGHCRKNTVNVLSLSSPGFKYILGIFYCFLSLPYSQTLMWFGAE